MDSFASTINSQIIRLDGLDALPSIFTIPICYWYENSSHESWDTFMPPALLERAFYKTLEEFPIFAGHLKSDGSSRLYVEVDKDNLNMPVYTDTSCELPYETLKESGFNTQKLPAGLREEHRVPAPSGKLFGGQIKSAYIRIVRFKDNSGVLVFATISHYIFDGYGYTQFMNRWAELARWMKLPQDTVFPTHPYIQDRSIHASYRSDQTTALGSSTVASMSSSTAFTKWMTWVSPQTRGRVFNAMLTRSNHICCFFHIPEQTMRDLRESVQKHVPQDMRFTINDVITAYLTIVVAQAKAKASAAWWSKPLPSMIRSLVGKDFGKSDSYVAVVYINQRARLSLPNIDKYMGNMAIGKSFPLSWDQVHEDPTDRVLAALAQKINQAITATDEQYVGQFGHLLDREPDNFMRLIACTMDTKNKLMTSNQSRFPHYGVDFGSGIPSMVRHAPHAFSDLAYVMPANPATGGGYEIEFNLAPEVAFQVVQNDTWMKLADRYDCYL